MIIIGIILLLGFSNSEENLVRGYNPPPQDESRPEKPTPPPPKVACNHHWEIRTENIYIPCADGEFMPSLSGEYFVRICSKCKLKERID